MSVFFNFTYIDYFLSDQISLVKQKNVSVMVFFDITILINLYNLRISVEKDLCGDMNKSKI